MQNTYLVNVNLLVVTSLLIICSFGDLSNRVVYGDQILNEIVTKVQMFAKGITHFIHYLSKLIITTIDFENVRNRVELAMKNPNAPNVGSFCDGFDEIAKVHETHLSFLRAQDEASKENFVVFARAKVCFSTCLLL